MRAFLAPAFLLLALFAVLNPAHAHPHVTVTVKSTLVLDKEARITAIHHHWTFDDAFSAYATEGFKKTPDGTFEAAALKELAKTNIESLEEYGFFTVLRKNKDKASFSPPIDYYLTYDGVALTLHFTLPIKGEAPNAKDMRLEVYDPTYFVAFSFAETEPVTIEGGNGACNASLSTPKSAVTQRLSQAGESFFQSLDGTNGDADWIQPVYILCK